MQVYHRSPPYYTMIGNEPLLRSRLKVKALSVHFKSGIYVQREFGNVKLQRTAVNKTTDKIVIEDCLPNTRPRCPLCTAPRAVALLHIVLTTYYFTSFIRICSSRSGLLIDGTHVRTLFYYNITLTSH